MANTLAYYNTATITAVKSFIVLVCLICIPFQQCSLWNMTIQTVCFSIIFHGKLWQWKYHSIHCYIGTTFCIIVHLVRSQGTLLSFSSLSKRFFAAAKTIKRSAFNSWNDTLIRINQLPASAAMWQHGSRMCFETFISWKIIKLLIIR